MSKQSIRVLYFLSSIVFSTVGWARASGDNGLSQALTLQPDIVSGQALFSERCSQCHGENAWGTYDGEFPQLAGQHKEVIIKQLVDIGSGNRANPKMFPIVEELAVSGPQAVADIAAYISTLPMNPEPELGLGIDLKDAEKRYTEMCAECHGINGEGEPKRLYPLLQGQHYEYLLRQLKRIGNGERKNSNPEMAELVREMNIRELESLADYMSRQLPTEHKWSAH